MNIFFAAGTAYSIKTGETGSLKAVYACANPCANTVRITCRFLQKGAKGLSGRKSRKGKATLDVLRVALDDGGGVWESNPPSTG